MALKSIIQIDVDDSRFQDFLKSFEKYQSIAQDIGSTTAQVKASQKAFTMQAVIIADTLQKQNGILAQQNKQYQAAILATNKLAGNTKAIAASIGATTLSLLKWVGIGGILGGLLGVGGLFGLDKLGEAIGNSRKEAGGLGITSGQLQSANINFGRYINVNSVLSGIASAQTNENLWAFGALGVNPEGKDPAQLLAELNLKAQAVYRPLQGKPMAERYPQVQALEALGYSIQDLRNLAHSGTGELRGATTRYGIDAKGLQLSPQAQLGWQLFTAQLARTGQQLENLLGKHLIALAPALETLSASVVKTVDKLISSGKFEEWINDFANGIETVGKYIGSDKFQNDMKTFAEDFGLVVEKLVAGLQLLHLIPSDKPGDIVTTGDPKTWDANSKKWAAGLSSDEIAKGKRIQAQFIAMGFSPAVAAGMAAQALSEGGDKDVFATGDSGHAYGRFQWSNKKDHWAGIPFLSDHLSRQDDYTRLFGHTMQSVKDGAQAEREQDKFAAWELTHGYKDVWSKLQKKPNDPNYAGGELSYGWERPKDQYGNVAARGALAQRIAVDNGAPGTVTVKVNPNTGGNPAVQLNQAAAAHPIYKF